MPAIPTNLITGFLGVGKTTAVLDLLKLKNPAGKWAVLVNEYGSVSIDEAFIEGETSPEGVSVRSVAGGCFCCTTAPMLPVALHFLLQDHSIQRLIIETSGMGHPARLVDTIRRNYAGRLDLRATLGIVTPSDFTAPGMVDSNPVFRDQITMSDVLVLNKSDTAAPGVIERFQAWANELFPPKLLIAATTQGRLDPAWLDLSSSDERRVFGDHNAGAVNAKGWTFPPEVVFDEDRLLALLGGSPGVTRLKGIFRTEEEWIAVNRAGGSLTTKPTAYRRDSRIEVFGDLDWKEFETSLLECAMSQGDTVAPLSECG
jgi:G3E family GTPase